MASPVPAASAPYLAAPNGYSPAGQPYAASPQQPQPYGYPMQGGQPAPQGYAYPQPQAAAYPYPQPAMTSPGATYQAPAVQPAPHVAVSMGGGNHHNPHKSPAPSEPGASHYSDVNNRPSGAGYSSFMDKHIRMGFIRKVYSILTLQLLLTFGITFIFVYVQSVKSYIQTHAGVYYAALGLNFGFMLALACCRQVTKQVPWNYWLLFAFTLTESYLVGTISSFYDTNTVLIAFGICIGITIALTLFACQTKYDFTIFLGVLIGLCWSLIIFGFLMIWFRSQALMTFYAWIGAFLFSCFIVVDTQMIIGGSHKLQFTPDDYISAALNLYIDVIGLFLQILRILGKK